MQIEILYFEGCPSHEATVELVNETVERLGLDADITEVDVETEEQAQQLEFIGSPSVWVDGVDIEPKAYEDVTIGRRCRVYSTPDGLEGTPPLAMLEAALVGEVYLGEASVARTQADADASEHDCCASPQRPRVRLLVADWCPQCPAAKTFWTNLQQGEAFDLDVIDIESKRGSELAAALSVRAVPASIVDDQLVLPQTPVPSRDQALEALGIGCC